MGSDDPSPPPPPRPDASSSRASSSTSVPSPHHRPSVPSALRNAHMPPSSPDITGREPPAQQQEEQELRDEGIPVGPEHNGAQPQQADAGAQGEIDESTDEPTARSRLLGFGNFKFRYPRNHACGQANCNHGDFSPRHRGYGSFASTFYEAYDGAKSPSSELSQDEFGGVRPASQTVAEDRLLRNSTFSENIGDAISDGLLGRAPKTSTTRWLAKRHGLKHRSLMYLRYYLPITQWVPQYRLAYLRGDLIAALTMASFYVPMALSYASNLAHTPPINGLYAFFFNPIIYAILGTCPQMVVGPEAAGSLLTGGVVTEAIKKGHIHDDDGVKHAQVAGMVTGLAGAIILVAGLCRLGFLDGVLSRPFLRGFISGIGITILVGQLFPEMGLDKLAEHSKRAQHGSSLDKIMFLADHGHEAHKLTCAVSFGTLAIVMVLREIKRRLQPRMPWVAYIPDRFIVVVLSAVITWKQGWADQGLDIMGDITTNGKPFPVHFPFEKENFRHVPDAFTTALVVAMLGFFESCVAAKALGTGTGKTRKVINKHGEEVEEPDGIRGMTISPNRELVALGTANLVGGLFMAIPAFGGYGRSKVNSSTGGKTPMSSVFLSLITLICVLGLMPYFYYIPKGVLSAMISVVAISLLEEAPHDIFFFWRIGGYSELFLMIIIFLATFFWDIKVGIVVGICLSLLRLLRHSTRVRIQIMGRVPGTTEFEDAEVLAQDAEFGVEMVPHCLIVKVPEPLTFANTGHLKDRLRRLEDHGTASAHPALPRVRRPDHNQNIIFDVHGVTALDPAAAQVLLEIVREYTERGTRVYFCRLPSRRGNVWRLMHTSGIVELCGGEHNFHRSVDAALQATERDSTLVFAEPDLDVASGTGVQAGGRTDDASQRKSASGQDRFSYENGS